MLLLDANIYNVMLAATADLELLLKWQPSIPPHFSLAPPKKSLCKQTKGGA